MSSRINLPPPPGLYVDQNKRKPETPPTWPGPSSSSTTRTGSGTPSQGGGTMAARLRAMQAQSSQVLKYVVRNRLGSTGLSEIYSVKDENNKKHALAKIGTEESLKAEVAIYEELGTHSNLNLIDGIRTVHLDGEERTALLMTHRECDGDEVRERLLASSDISDADRFNVILPFIGRALYDFANHAAAKKVSHGNIDPSNILFSIDPVEVVVTDMEHAKREEHAAEESWVNVEDENPAKSLYATDAISIARALRMFAGLPYDPGEHTEATQIAPEAMALMQFLSRTDPTHSGESPQVKQSSDFRYLDLDDVKSARARELLQQLLRSSGNA